MTAWGVPLALAVAAGLAVAAEGWGRAAILPTTAGTVTIQRPPGDTLRSATPTFVIVTTGFAPTEHPLRVSLQLSARADFATVELDTSVITRADTTTITLARPLRERVTLYARALVLTSLAEEAASASTAPFVTATLLVLVSPNAVGGSTVTTSQPTFVWSSAEVTSPPGPWEYELTIRNVATGQLTVARGLRDTVFQVPSRLESNTSYRWSVTARLETGDSVKVNSRSSFVIANPEVPLVTLLYQNWPNPFPSAASATTCIWFDLRETVPVRLDVYSLRGDHVRTLIPTGDLSRVFFAGRYGRGPGLSDSGCDTRFSWDGRSDAGRVVPAGVYLLRLRAGGVESVRKMLFRGR